jgi:hypothetical protein
MRGRVQNSRERPQKRRVDREATPRKTRTARGKGRKEKNTARGRVTSRPAPVKKRRDFQGKGGPLVQCHTPSMRTGVGWATARVEKGDAKESLGMEQA